MQGGVGRIPGAVELSEWVRRRRARLMGRVACCEQVGLKKGPWTPDEDAKLVAYIQRRGHGSWRALPKRAGMSSVSSTLIIIFVNLRLSLVSN